LKAWDISFACLILKVWEGDAPKFGREGGNLEGWMCFRRVPYKVINESLNRFCKSFRRRA